MELVPIPGGSIRQRDDRTHRQWAVHIQPFVLGSVPVTQALYRDITGLSPSSFVLADAPVESVSWWDAVRFCNAWSHRDALTPCYALNGEDVQCVPEANGYRLPTEAEWEYACRAGTNTPRYGNLEEIAWSQDNADGHPHAVGRKQPNAWGVFDMLGNVWEWCWDQYDAEVYGSYRVFRGGGWADGERGCLASNRRRSHPTFAIDDLGFRVARNL